MRIDIIDEANLHFLLSDDDLQNDITVCEGYIPVKFRPSDTQLPVSNIRFLITIIKFVDKSHFSSLVTYGCFNVCNKPLRVDLKQSSWMIYLLCMISGFHRSADEIFALIGRNAA